MRTIVIADVVIQLDNIGDSGRIGRRFDFGDNRFCLECADNDWRQRYDFAPDDQSAVAGHGGRRTIGGYWLADDIGR